MRLSCSPKLCNFNSFIPVATLSNAAAATYAIWPSPVLSLLQSEDSPVGRPISDVSLPSVYNNMSTFKDGILG